MSDPLDILRTGFAHAEAYRKGVSARSCGPERDYAEMLESFGEPLPERGQNGEAVISELVQKGEPGLTPMVHPRFFGWVLGGSDPVGVAADWLVSAWGQNAAFHESSPTASALEEIAGRWLLDILDLPGQAAVGFVTGATVANFTALAAARGAILRRSGWDPDADGLFGAPPITVFVGDDAHTSVFSALGYLGLGRNRVCRVRTDAQGRMEPTDLERRVDETAGPKIIIAQAGQINTGAFDPFPEIVNVAREAQAWLHVDGAFGLWARAHPSYNPLTTGVELADSWAVDGHKWLQTPFDSGYTIVRDTDALRQAMQIDASYLPPQTGEDRIPCFLVPELSRRARGVPTWAMLKTLGRDGIEELVDRHCSVAKQISARLDRISGVCVLNEVQLNQIIVEFGASDTTNEQRGMLTEAVITRIRDLGVIFVGGARWKGAWVMRISVICNATGPTEIDAVVNTISSAWADVRANTVKTELSS
ncbi:aspartate aminotransferase family protein [Rhodobacteraceae bacterium B1Z28]|uniref:Aspartate aminotransferase family protein n=1 Tax=Ruegeria haliotis TaxID=2747601 RepID=A0ABX2PWD7_9RHOB|nr:aspartate aminotransferase family protein [Ruegeria haliotis]NVO58094.1 aspartate aminotransferase family protein [Ruegeria haliotis]